MMIGVQFLTLLACGCCAADLDPLTLSIGGQGEVGDIDGKKTVLLRCHLYIQTII
jgi:hypothetical protein